MEGGSTPRTVRFALWVAVLGIAAYVGIGIYLAGRNELPSPPANPAVVFHQGVANGRRIQFPSWSADYDRIVTNADQTVLNVDGVHDGIIYRKGKPYLRVRAAHFTVNTVTHDFSAIGPIDAQTIGSKPQRSFQTTSAVWSDAAQQLTMAQPVRIDTGAEAPLKVGSLTLNVRTGEVTVHKIAGPIRLK